MRNKFIIRLGGILALFIAYAGGMGYFNYYVHDVNTTAVDIFFAYNNRAIYSTSTALFLKEAIGTGNKLLVSNNPGTSLFACLFFSENTKRI